jgi:hypothetical protein
MPDYSFDTPEPVDLTVRIPSGTVAVTAADVTTSTVEVRALDDEARDLAEQTLVELRGRELVVELPERKVFFSLRRRRLAVTVTVPTRSGLRVKSASAAIRADGRYATADVDTASGAVRVGDVDGDVSIRCASGTVHLDSGRAVSVHTASGAVEVGRAAGDVDVHCASGEVRIGVAEASVKARTASGDITVDEAASGTVALTAASGDLRVGVRSGVLAKLDVSSVSGKVRSELRVDDAGPAGGAPLEIRARTTSGSVLLVPARRRD